MESLRELDKLYNEGICWECYSHLCVDFMHPDKDNWVLAACPNCNYQVYVPRNI